MATKGRSIVGLERPSVLGIWLTKGLDSGEVKAGFEKLEPDALAPQLQGKSNVKL